MVHTHIPQRVSGLVYAALCLALSCMPASGTPKLSAGGSAPSGGTAASSTAIAGAGGTLSSSSDEAGGVLQSVNDTREPDDSVLKAARLVKVSCDDLRREARQQQERQIEEMHQAMRNALENWRAEQPDCWRQYESQAQAADPRGMAGPAFGAGSPSNRKYAAHGVAPASGAMSGNTSSGHYAAPSAPKSEGFGSGHGRLGGSPATSAPSRRSASATNNQVASVDEADIVKQAGDYLYFAVNGALRIVTATAPHLVSVTQLPGQAREMFVQGDRVAVFASKGAAVRPRCTYAYDCQFTGDGTQTSLLIYDVKDRSHPVLTRRLDFSGSLLASRRIDSMVHVVVSNGDEQQRVYYSTWPDQVPRCGIHESAVKEQLKRLEAENERRIRQLVQLSLPSLSDNGVTRDLCDSVYRTAIDDRGAFTSLVSLDMQKEALATHNATIQSHPGAVFASVDAVYLAVVHRRNTSDANWHDLYPDVDEVTDIHRFTIGRTPSETLYSGSGVVPGHVLNQFSMDEWTGNLRIATTQGRLPNPNVESQVSIMATTPSGNLVRLGSVEHLAPGEDIRSVRFEGDRGYVVTFKKTDPLFVLDLRRPTAPKVLGELKIPGFSTYMHRIDDTHLLSIGFDANDHGSFAYFDGVILQLFDVSNPIEPRLLFKEKIGTRGSSSAAATDHLAFNYFAERGLLAIPMTICEGGSDGHNGNQLTFSGLLIYAVSTSKGFHRLGGVNHGTVGQNCGTWWSKATSGVKRSVFVDDLVFSMAMDRVKVQQLKALGRDVADIKLL